MLFQCLCGLEPVCHFTQADDEPKITILSGLKEVKTKYVVKLRSDSIITGDGFIKYFEKYQDFPLDKELLTWKVFTKRIVTLPTMNVRGRNVYPFNISDWFYFGLLEDVLYLFDTELIDTFSMKVRENEYYPHIEDNFGAEQYYWGQCLEKSGRKIDIKNAIDRRPSVLELSEKALALNFIPISAAKLGVYNIKYGKHAYGSEPCLSHGFYLLDEWEKIYILYGGGMIAYKYNLVEHIVKTLYLLKDWIVEEYPGFGKLYKMILAFFRKIFNNKKDMQNT